MRARLRLVVPCYNEAGRLNVDAFLQLANTRCDTALLFVDDGSTDATPTVLAGLASRAGGKVTVLRLPDNAGKAAAVQRGILMAMQQGAELVGYWDADLSTPLAALPAFLEVFEERPEVDIVTGARVKLLGRRIDRNAVRHYCGRMFATAASLVLEVAVYDTQCGAKIFRVNDAVRQTFAAPFRSRWIFDVEILARYIAATGAGSAASRIYELPLAEWSDVPGSKLNVRQAARAVWDLGLIWRRRTPQSGDDA
jgi:glycosyltransferase involved in cell wall biosynthesis